MQSQEKPTKFGIISSILAILLSVIWCVYIVILMIYTQREVTSINVTSALVSVVFFYGCLLVMAVLNFLMTITGMVLSVLSLRKGEPIPITHTPTPAHLQHPIRVIINIL